MRSKSGTIDLFVRTPASGTQDAFDKIFMSPPKIFSGASQKASNGLVQQSVQSDKNGVGYVSEAFTKGLTVASYKGVPCSLRNAKSGTVRRSPQLLLRHSRCRHRCREEVDQVGPQQPRPR